MQERKIENEERFLITSALPYANGYLHLGHCAGAYLPADIFARFLRLNGMSTLYVCGSDEHGVAITIAAEKENVTPKQIIDKYHEANRKAFERFAMSFDIYSRTSHPIHFETAREFFADFLKKGYLVEKEEEQFFDTTANMFLPDRYVEGVCPNCGYNKARGDQCDNCGAYYNQLELLSPRSLISGQKPTVKKTTHWYFKFNLFQKFLEDYIEQHSLDWKENVLQQTRSWLRQGLKERAITRDLAWGIPVEDIDGIDKEKAKGKVMYVWFEAVLGYISATKHLMQELSQKKICDEKEWEKWWKDLKTRYIAFIGKDNIIFHTLLFPAMLYARGDGYILPENVPANEFLNLEGEKFSKSRHWSIDLQDFLSVFDADHYIDSLRYALACNFPETKDSDFTWKEFQTRNNSELAAIFGNFINRTIQFLAKNFQSKIPKLSSKYEKINEIWEKLITKLKDKQEIQLDDFEPLNRNDIELARSLVDSFISATANFRRFKLRDAVAEIMNLPRSANKYFNDEEPWKTFKTDPERCAKTLYICSQLLNTFAIIFAPIVPFTSKKIFNSLNIEFHTGEPNFGIPSQDVWSGAISFHLPEGRDIQKPEILFPIVEDRIIAAQIAKLGKSPEQIEEESRKNIISYDDFARIQLRTAKVLEAERVKKSRKLIQLKIDIGTERRQIVAGIGEHYLPEELIGKTIVVVVNLEPVKLMGVESQGMLLAASSEDGKHLSILSISDDKIPPGSVVK